MTPGRPGLTDPTRTASSRESTLTTRDKQNLFGWEGSYSEQITSKFQQVTSVSVSTNDYYFRSPYGDSYSNNLRGVLNTRSEVAVSNKDFFVAGFEYNREQVEDTYIADTNGVPFVLPRTSLAFFAENRWSPTHRLYLTTGFRVDDLRTQRAARRRLPRAARCFLPARWSK